MILRRRLAALDDFRNWLIREPLELVENDGARFNPVTNMWTALAFAPIAARAFHTAVTIGT